jgi:hypothetical protein
MSVCCECCVSSDRGLCDELITRPEESYRLWGVVVCDLETSLMRRPWPTGGCCTKKNSFYIFHFNVHHQIANTYITKSYSIKIVLIILRHIKCTDYILIIKANEMQHFSALFGKELNMFRTDSLSIIRSLNTVFTAIGICPNSNVDCLP